MGRLILLALAVLVLVWLLRRALGARGRAAPRSRGGSELVQCAHCGVHLPRAEARGEGDALYCSEEHARLGPRAR
jgi:uncharacterized protein